MEAGGAGKGLVMTSHSTLHALQAEWDRQGRISRLRSRIPTRPAGEPSLAHGVLMIGLALGSWGFLLGVIQ